MTDDGTIELFAFRYRDPRTGRWVRTRYRATLANIAAAHAEWELLGPPEVRRPAAAATSIRCAGRASDGDARGREERAGDPLRAMTLALATAGIGSSASVDLRSL